MSGATRALELAHRLTKLGADYRRAIAGARLDELAAIDEQRLQVAIELQQLQHSARQSREDQQRELSRLLDELEHESECMRQLLISLKDELQLAIEQQRQMSRGLASYHQATTRQV